MHGPKKSCILTATHKLCKTGFSFTLSLSKLASLVSLSLFVEWNVSLRNNSWDSQSYALNCQVVPQDSLSLCTRASVGVCSVQTPVGLVSVIFLEEARANMINTSYWTINRKYGSMNPVCVCMCVEGCVWEVGCIGNTGVGNRVKDGEQ